MANKQLAAKVFGRQALFPLKQVIPMLERWFSHPVGEAILESQRQCLDKLLQPLYGKQVLQLSMLRDTAFSTAYSDKPLCMGPLAGGKVKVLCDDEQLPVMTESVNVAVVHHFMEYSQNPHQLLKELTRAVLPSGHIVIIGFNPYSFLGMRSFLGRFQHGGVWHNHPLTAKRVADWLTLLDFTVTDVRYGFYQLPFNLLVKHRVLKPLTNQLKSRQIPFGGFYIIVAKKEVAPLTPSNDYLQYIRKSMIPIMEPSLYTRPRKT